MIYLIQSNLRHVITACCFNLYIASTPTSIQTFKDLGLKSSTPLHPTHPPAPRARKKRHNNKLKGKNKVSPIFHSSEAGGAEELYFRADDGHDGTAKPGVARPTWL